MTRSLATWPISGCLAAVLAASMNACAPPAPPTADSRAAQATANACRQRADETYRRQNRGALYSQNQSEYPESANYVSGITTRGLADRYDWDTQVSDCVNQGTGGAVAPGFSPGPSPVKGTGGTGNFVSPGR